MTRKKKKKRKRKRRRTDKVEQTSAASAKKLKTESPRTQLWYRRFLRAGVIGVVLAVVFFLLNEWRGRKEQQQLVVTLEQELIENLGVLRDRLLEADRTYVWMRSLETPSPLIVDPYGPLGERLRRDLPRFKLNTWLQNKASPAFLKEPLRSYARLFSALESVDEVESKVLRGLDLLVEPYEDLGARPVWGSSKMHRESFRALIGQYLMAFDLVSVGLDTVEPGRLPSKPGDLEFLKDLARERGTSHPPKDDEER